MSKAASVSLVAVVACAAFAVGVAVGNGKKREIEPHHPGAQPLTETEESDRSNTLPASLQDLRRILDERELKIRELNAELEEMRAKVPPPLDPEDKEWLNNEIENREQLKRLRAREARSKALRNKILQRRDKALRAEGLEELANLLQSKDADDVVVGLLTTPSLENINCDRTRYVAHVLALLNHEDPELRRRAPYHLPEVCDDHEIIVDAALPLVNDPSPEVRGLAAWRLDWFARDKDHREREVVAALRELVQDEDALVRSRAVGTSERWLGSEEIENLTVEMSRDPEMAEYAIVALEGRSPISARVAERLADMFDEGYRANYRVGWTHRELSEDAKPIAREFCLHIIRDSIEAGDRRAALEGLASIGDASALAQLEEISRGPDAEGIEQRLVWTIRQLQKRLREER